MTSRLKGILFVVAIAIVAFALASNSSQRSAHTVPPPNTAPLHVGMEASEVKEILRKAGIDFVYRMGDHESCILGVSEAEYRAYMENPPASPTRSFTILARFDEDERLKHASVDLNGQLISINPFVLDPEAGIKFQ